MKQKAEKTIKFGYYGLSMTVSLSLNNVFQTMEIFRVLNPLFCVTL